MRHSPGYRTAASAPEGCFGISNAGDLPNFKASNALFSATAALAPFAIISRLASARRFSKSVSFFRPKGLREFP
jgi:hypothetical protein